MTMYAVLTMTMVMAVVVVVLVHLIRFTDTSQTVLWMQIKSRLSISIYLKILRISLLTALWETLEIKHHCDNRINLVLKKNFRFYNVKISHIRHFLIRAKRRRKLLKTNAVTLKIPERNGNMIFILKISQ